MEYPQKKIAEPTDEDMTKLKEEFDEFVKSRRPAIKVVPKSKRKLRGYHNHQAMYGKRRVA